MAPRSQLTERQRFWLEHLRACGNGSLKVYAEAHELDVRALYEAKARLKRRGLLPGARPAQFVRVHGTAPASAPALCRIHLANGAVVELACEPGDWPRLLADVAALA